MSNRTFACLHCRKLQRKPSVTPVVCCPHCGRECICVHWKLHVPAPRKTRKWEKFWQQYLLELRLIEQFNAGMGPDQLYLPLLNQYRVRASAEAARELLRRNAQRARRKKLARRRQPA